MNPIPVPELAKAVRPDCQLVSMGPPRGVSDDDCGTAEMLISGVEHRMLGFPARRQYAYYRPSEAELEQLRNGGFLEFCQYGQVVQPFSASIWPAPADRDENPTGSNLVAHAIRELDLIGETDHGEPSMRRMALDIVRQFAEQGHSGSSAAWLTAVLDKLLRFQPLSPITDDPADWIQVSDNPPPYLWQCRRDPECFSINRGKTYTRNSDEGTVHQSVPHQGAAQ